MSKYLIAGLGNIGKEYQDTRHNIGFEVVDAFARKHGFSFQIDRLAEVGTFKWKGKNLVFIKPSTYMNLSGKAVKYWRDKEKVDIGHVLVIVDDLSLPITKIRLRASGSDGGHNGLKSVHECLGTTHYPRLRFGIGNDFPKGGQVDFVLGKWTEVERRIVNQKVEKCTEVIENMIVMGLESAMHQANNLVLGG